MSRSLRALLLAAFVLAAIVVAISATLRLAANGIGCAPWPACYGQEATAAVANEATAARALRLAHRVAATAFALVALGVVAVGWPRWPRANRVAGVVLLAVTVLLAWVGRYTPSPLPAVTLTNVLGGFALLGLLAFLWVNAASRPRDAAGGFALTSFVGVLLAALAIQAAGGALISARLAGDACASACGNLWRPGAAALLQPWLPGAASEIVALGGEPLHLWHRFGGLALLLGCAISAGVLLERGRRWAGAAVCITAAVGALGFVAASSVPALPVVALHALAAGLLCAALAALLAATRAGETGK